MEELKIIHTHSHSHSHTYTDITNRRAKSQERFKHRRCEQEAEMLTIILVSDQ